MLYTIVYNLSEIVPGVYLPAAYIGGIDDDGLPNYFQQKATEKTLDTYQLEMTPIRKRLLDISDNLSPKQLEKKFNPPKKKPRTLAELSKDPLIWPQVLIYLHRELDNWLQLVCTNGFPMTFEAEKKVVIKLALLNYSEDSLIPNFAFRHTPEGVEYRFRLGNGTDNWTIQSKKVIPLTNNPAWLVVDDFLYKVPYINGNLVLPFRTKDEVFIPKASVKTYFQKFILRMVGQLDVEAEGFEVQRCTDIVACRLDIVHDFFHGYWGIALHFDYGHGGFSWKEQRKSRTQLDFGVGDDVVIYQMHRNLDAEKLFVDHLIALGCEEGPGAFFRAPVVDEDMYDLLEWLIPYKDQLTYAGFTLAPVMHLERPFILEIPQITVEAKKQNDWFDLDGIVQIGEFHFPFHALAPYILEGNRIFPLPNGGCFLIPKEWMTKYSQIVRFGKKQDGQWRLSKSHFTLLEAAGLNEDLEAKLQQEVGLFLPSKWLKATLRPYQHEGAEWLTRHYERELGACLADDMGLGKTLQTIAALLHALERKKAVAGTQNPGRQMDIFQPILTDDFLCPLNALIVLPASLVYNWEEEIKSFAPMLTVYQHTGPKRHKDIRLIGRFDVVLSTYQTVMRDATLLKNLEWEYIVLDESQQIKNKDSQAFRAVFSLSAKHNITLSGTPIENSLSDVWSQMEFINPGLLGSYTFFEKQFLQPIEKQGDGEKMLELKQLVSPFLLRRRKEEVAKDLPPLTTKIVYSEMTTEQEELYESEKSVARNSLLDQYRSGDPNFSFQVLQALTRLRQIADHPGMVIEDYKGESGKFKDILEQWSIVRKSGHKMLFFSSFVKYLDFFKKNFEAEKLPFARLTGDMEAKKRQAEIIRFEKEPSVDTFLISLKAGGSGLNLTAADYVFMLDPWWNPAAEMQAIARAHRIGQDKSVIALKFIAKKTIEEKILHLQSRKVQLANDLLEETGAGSLTRDDLAYLLE